VLLVGGRTIMTTLPGGAAFLGRVDMIARPTMHRAASRRIGDEIGADI
jgi:hypothetical protein